MSDDTKTGVPDPVRKIVEAMVSQALARCDQLGISWEDFLRAMLEERKVRSTGDVTDLFERTFRRILGTAN
jgi:hypothetical protein